MCRGFQQNERDRLKIKAFYIHLSISCTKKPILPDFLTLHYLPRINGTLLSINGSTIRPDSPAFVTLHRVWTPSSEQDAVYGCKERISACEGVRFEVYFGDLKFVKGVFRKDYDHDDDEGEEWVMGCRCDEVVEGVKSAQVSVAVEGGGVVNERVEMVAERRRRRCCELEEIPEVREEGECCDVCRCSECSGEDDDDDGEVEGVEMEGVRWAVDVGIWVACIGVGYLVSRASSSRRFRKSGFIG